MAMICNNIIRAYSTAAEMIEIENAFKKERIDWPPVFSMVEFSLKEIKCGTENEPLPLKQGYMEKLSKAFPEVLFKYTVEQYRSKDRVTWLSNGVAGSKIQTKKIHFDILNKSAERFLDNTNKVATGTNHKVELTSEGTVQAEGSTAFGQCNVGDWRNLIQISCGNLHTVGLSSTNKIYACGSNSNKQCNVSQLKDSVKQITCGRYHTAALMNSGDVMVFGQLGEGIQYEEDEKVLAYKSIFPFSLVVQDYTTNRKNRIETIEELYIGEELDFIITSVDEYWGGAIFAYEEGTAPNEPKEYHVEAFTKSGSSVGLFFPYNDEIMALRKNKKNIKVYVESVTPLSSRTKRAKYAKVTIRFELDESADSPTNTKIKKGRRKSEGRELTVDDGVIRLPAANWHSINYIISVFDGVIGIDRDGLVFVDGNIQVGITEKLKGCLLKKKNESMFGSNLITDPTDRIEELSSEKGTNDSDSSIHEERKVIAETQKMKISTEQERIVESTTIESEPVFVNISFEQEDFSITKEGTLIKYIGQKEHVKIPKGVKIIGEGAFEDRKNLVSISIPQGVLRIERGAFSKCKALINVQIPSSVKIIGEGAFSYCDKLSSVFLSDGIIELGASVFAYCISLESIEVPNSIVKIGQSAFHLCEKLKNIKLPFGLKSIENWTFLGCIALEEISLPTGVRKIGDNAFAVCFGLKNIEFSAELKSIGKAAFSRCKSLIDITIPDTVTYLGERAFKNCISLESVVLSKSMFSIESQSFIGCSKLTKVEIPASILSIAKNAFLGIKKLVIYGEHDSYAKDWAKGEKIRFKLDSH